jgi:hypothetical protein
MGLDDIQAKQLAFNKMIEALIADALFQNRLENSLKSFFTP